MIRKPPADEVLNELSARVTGRTEPLFEKDLERNVERIRDLVASRRILVVGGAGSIGSSTVLQLLRFRPAHVTVADVAENNLVELLRTVRSSRDTWDADVAIQPIDYGSPIMERFLATQAPFDVVLNFAAAKHVRSERDVISLLVMLDTNLVKADVFLGWVRRYGHGGGGVFFVSSDKAANPANLMGASKRMMEQMLFWHASPAARGRTLLDDGAACGAPLARATTARFANVAFSDGSLPWGFLRRIAKRQPLSGPSDVKRFFLSLEESGQLCTLASLVCPSEHILIPRLDPAADLHSFQDVARLTLAYLGHEPAWCASECEARTGAPVRGAWPCYFQTSDTMGEKLCEEFVAEGERTVEVGLRALKAVPHEFSADAAALANVFRQLRASIAFPALSIDKPAIVELIRSAVPTLQHVESNLSLDRKM
jgi:nucleoside-diphosphate-sugar epimerase